MKTCSPGLLLVAGVVCWGAALNLAGWGLSLFRSLNGVSYGLILFALLSAFFVFFRTRSWPVFFLKTCKRSRRPLPAVFAGAVTLVFMGAVFYPPSNYDALTYRIPRIMHWLDQGGWHWITTANARQNYSGVGQEWLLAPILALTKTDRFLFLPNFLCFLLLPSVLFRVFRSLGFSGRAARTWMWLLPFAPVYLLQAGGIANDLLGAFWFLSSLALLPGRLILGSSPAGSILAVALATGVKASNLVLLLPWLVKFLCEAFRRNSLWRPALATAPLAFLVSFAPVACLNQHHTGDWSGDPLNEGGMKTESPTLTLAGNTALVLTASFQQPIDFGGYYILKEAARFVPQQAKDKFLAAYPRWGLEKAEFAIEEGAAWSWLLIALAMAGRVLPGPDPRGLTRWLFMASWISALTLMGKLASESVPRLLAPLYPLLFMPAGFGSRLPRRFLHFSTFAVVFLLSVPLFLAPSRPLVPWSLIGQTMDALCPTSKFSSRINQVQQVYQRRVRGLQPLIPIDLKKNHLKILLISNGNDTEGPLWWPYGKRSVESRRKDGLPPALSPDLILIREKDWAAWQGRWGVNAEVKSMKSLSLLARTGPENWLCLQPTSWPYQP